MTYIEAISLGFPGVGCHALGDGTTYEDIVWDNGLPLPSKETLDAWIASNDVPTVNKKITVYAFRQRLTMQEKILIDLTSIDNPTASIEQRQLSAFLRVILTDLSQVTYVDLADVRLHDMLNALTQYGLLASGRADEIINAPIQAIELADC